MSAPPTSDVIDQVVLGRYRIVRELARGGMGAVYLGRTEGAQGFARPVVIKRVLPWLNQERDIAEMFVREARILSNLQHPNIVGVLDFGQQHDGSYLMVLDYVHGYDLAQWQAYVSNVRGRVPVEYALHIVCKVLDALHYAHTLKRADGKALGIVHRDVTPTNVYLSDQGGVKLLDFGIALVVDEERKYTGRNEVRGKLPYLPAEVCGGAEPSAAGDVYAAGVMLYELLTGINPFDGGSPAEIFCKILQASPLPVCAIRADAPAELDSVVACSMDRNLEHRYGTAAEFAQALRAVPRRPDDVVAAELAEQLREDFMAMPGKLGLDSLPAREHAWRGATSGLPPALWSSPRPVRVTGQPAASGDVHPGATAPISMTEALSTSQPPQVADATLCAAVPADIIDRAVRSSPPPPASMADGVAQRGAGSSLSLSRLLMVAGAAGVCGAIAVLVAWLAISRDAPGQERMVVIAKESVGAPDAGAQKLAQSERSPPAVNAGSGAAGAAPLAHASPPKTPEPVRSSGASTSRPARQPVAAAPDAQTLSRVFARKQRSVQSCFSKHATGETNLPQVSIHFHVAVSGAVDDVRLTPETLAAQPLGRCLLDVAKRTRFGPLQRAVSFHIPISAEKVMRSSL